MPQPSSPAPKSKIDKLPAIKNWKPAPIFSVLGLLASVVVWNNLASYVGEPLACAIQAIVVIIYVLVFYRSYFTEKPRITSSKGISFLNYAIVFHTTASIGDIIGVLCVASVIFGVFLNRNLKRSHDEEDPWTGISYIVAIVFFLALVGFTTWYEGIPHIIANGDGTYKMTQPAANSTQDSSSSTAHQSQENTLQRLTIPGTNSQITISGEWKYLTRNNSDKSLNDGLVLIPPSTGKYAGLLVYATDMSQYVNEYINQYGENPNVEIIDKDAVLGQNSVTINSLQNETAELVEINGIEYWKAQAEGTSSDSNLVRKSVSYFCLVGTNLYEYTLFTTDESDETNEALAADLEQIVASASYQ